MHWFQRDQPFWAEYDNREGWPRRGLSESLGHGQHAPDHCQESFTLNIYCDILKIFFIVDQINYLLLKYLMSTQTEGVTISSAFWTHIGHKNGHKNIKNRYPQRENIARFFILNSAHFECPHFLNPAQFGCPRFLNPALFDCPCTLNPANFACPRFFCSAGKRGHPK